MLAASGRRVFVGGNIGTPLIAHVDSGARVEVVVAEVSSFQLDTSDTFRPAVGVLLNVTDDHLDRYAGFEAYAASKMRLFANQRPGDTAVLNAADAVILARADGIRSRKLFYNRPGAADAHAVVAGRTLNLRVPGRRGGGTQPGGLQAPRPAQRRKCGRRRHWPPWPPAPPPAGSKRPWTPSRPPPTAWRRSPSSTAWSM
ncbi:MAG: Mur ligase family protein [Desulfobacterales bacterium]|nr:Mur ligase family protein [Desulfobacterales bacterium]